MLRLTLLWALAPLAALSAAALVHPPRAAAQEAGYVLTIHDDHFQPASLDVKAGVKFKLTVKNARKVAAEFESHDLKREKVVPAGGSVVLNVGPLKAGSYALFDDFHKSTTGTMVAK